MLDRILTGAKAFLVSRTHLTKAGHQKLSRCPVRWKRQRKLSILRCFTLIASLTLTGCDDPERARLPKLRDPQRFKFTFTVSDEGKEKSASSVVEVGEQQYRMTHYMKTTWTIMDYTVGAAAFLDLETAGSILVPIHSPGFSEAWMKSTDSTGLIIRNKGARDQYKEGAGGIVESFSKVVGKMLVDRRLALKTIHHKIDVPEWHFPGFVYFPNDAKAHRDAMPLLSTEFNHIPGNVRLVSVTIEPTSEMPKKQFSPTPLPQWHSAKRLKGYNDGPVPYLHMSLASARR